jgi:hypothetical protein
MGLDIGSSDTMMRTFVCILVNHSSRYQQKKAAGYLKTDLLLLLQDSLSQSLILFRYSLSKEAGKASIFNKPWIHLERSN